MKQQTDIAYAAGIMDGEGCLCLSRSQRKGGAYYVPFVTVKMADKAVPAWLQNVFGGNLYENPATKSCEETSSWRLSAKELLECFIAEILPHLKTKRLPAIIILEFLTKFSKGSVQRTEETLLEMQKYYEFMQVANGRGPGSTKQKERFLQLIEGKVAA